MESEIKVRNSQRKTRTLRVRKGVFGSAERPRLTVFKSNRHLFAQIVNDEVGRTLVSAGTLSLGIQGKSKEAARQVGHKLAELAKAAQIEKVVFHRGRHQYHGVIQELADTARKSGLQF